MSEGKKHGHGHAIAGGDPLPVNGTDETRVPTDADVVHTGTIIGSDPDENVREQMLRDFGSSTGS